MSNPDETAARMEEILKGYREHIAPEAADELVGEDEALEDEALEDDPDCE